MGQTWSKPYIGYIAKYGADTPVLIFGGGYDTRNDSGISASGNDKGNQVYIVDADSGSFKYKFSLGRHSVPGNIAVLDSDFDGYIDRLYAADTGGDIYRMDMPTGEDTNQWWSHKLASLNDQAAGKRFFYQPEVVRTYFSNVTKKTNGG